jgi:CRISPR system Cascade subunit CasE
MYLSQLVLNGRDRSVQRDLSNAHALHQRIMQAFPDNQSVNPRANWNLLFRHEPDSDVILVQSSLEPTWEKLPHSYLMKHAVKLFEHQTSQLEAGRIIQFPVRPTSLAREAGIPTRIYPSRRGCDSLR